MNLPTNYLDFKIGDQPFAQWFNAQGSQRPVLFHNPIQEANFQVFYENLPILTGNKETSLTEFIGHFCIAYNETGGTFRYAIREGGDMSYIFSQRIIKGNQSKRSYNIAPNRLAGDQLKEMGLISSVEEVNLWNGTQFPTGTHSPELLQALTICDFWRYRGYGFNQLTWLTNFTYCVEPVIAKKYGKKMDEIRTEQEFDQILSDSEVSFSAFRNFIFQNSNAKKAIEDLKKGKFAAYGNIVSGGWKYYVNEIYLPRCYQLQEMLQRGLLKEPKRYSIDGLGLTRQQIKFVQQAMAEKSDEAAKILKKNGGFDGYWGNATEQAWQISGLDMNDLQKIAQTTT